MDIKDLAGLSEPLRKLVEVVAEGIGGISRPLLTRKNADAKAYEINQHPSLPPTGTTTPPRLPQPAKEMK